MNFKKAMPILAAALMICAGQVNSANAYFTTYVTAQGGYIVSWDHEEEMKEEFEKWCKYVTISAKEGSVPVFIRAKAFAGSTYPLKIEGGDWKYNDNDGYWYFKSVLYEGQTTSALKVGISEIPQTPRLGDNFNVAVIYESIPAVFDFYGNPINPMDGDWTSLIGSETIVDN